jgi:hypothetical protein
MVTFDADWLDGDAVLDADWSTVVMLNGDWLVA